MREAVPDDAPAIAEAHVETWQEAYRGLLPQELLDGLPATLERRRRFWHDVATMHNPGEALLVAETDGRVVGFAHVMPSRDEDADETVGELTAIYLRPDQWGRGLGRALLMRAAEVLRDASFSEATLWVLEANERARRFYEAAGWRADGSTREERMGDATLHEVRYRVALRASPRGRG